MCQSCGLVGAIIDATLRDGAAFDMARTLKALRVPFVFTTGLGPKHFPDDLQNEQILFKPFDPSQIEAAVRQFGSRAELMTGS
jgi:hypothetical protein